MTDSATGAGTERGLRTLYRQTRGLPHVLAFQVLIDVFTQQAINPLFQQSNIPILNSYA
jgi:hypothetical protein